MADQESQILSLALAPQYKLRKRDEKFKPLKRETSRSSKCFVYFFTFIVFMGAIALTFSLIVFRIAAPNLKLQSVIIKNLKFNSSSSPSSPPYLNMTFIAEIQVKNDNFGTFKFQNSSTSVFYDGTPTGTSGFFGGEVRGRETKSMNVTVKVRSGVLVNQTYLNDDLNSGLVKLRSYADFRGKVRVLKIAKQSKVSVLDCTMNLNLTSMAIQDILCAEN